MNLDEHNLYVGGYAKLCKELLTIPEIEKAGHIMEHKGQQYSVKMFIYTVFGIKKVCAEANCPDFCGFSLYEHAIDNLIRQFKYNEVMVKKLQNLKNKRISYDTME